MPSRHWTKDELLVALNLYFGIPYNQIGPNNSEILALARFLDRSPGSVEAKLFNFAHLDPDQKVKALYHVSKLDRQVWNEFHSNLEKLADESHIAFLKLQGESNFTPRPDVLGFIDVEETETKATTKQRRHQNIFRRVVLANYRLKCAFCGLAVKELLIASHIVPWKVDAKRRVDPTNGICLCALHDKAFDAGFLSIDSDLKIIVSSEVDRENPSALHQVGLLAIEGISISLPNRYPPASSSLKYHRTNIFRP